MSSTYITKLGDMWDQIAYNQLGDAAYTKDLIEANPGYYTVINSKGEEVKVYLRDLVIFSAGMKLAIPDIDDSDTVTESSPPWEDED